MVLVGDRDRPRGLPGHVERVLDQCGAGRPSVLFDDFRDFGAVVMPATCIDEATVNFLITFCRGILYVAIPEEGLRAIGIPQQVTSDSNGSLTLHLPVDVKSGTTTGISAADRTQTIRALLSNGARLAEFRVPGHVTPLATNPGGVLRNPRLPEAMADILKYVGLPPVVVFSLILNMEGSVGNREFVEQFAVEHGLPFITIFQVIRLIRRIDRDDLLELDDSLSLRVPNIGVGLSAIVRGGYAPTDVLRVQIFELCPHSMLTRDACGCRDAIDNARDALFRKRRGALGVYWKSRGLVGDCPRDRLDQRLTSVLEDYLASYVAGARPKKLIP